MRDDLAHAVRLRKEGRAEEARTMLLGLAAERPDDPQVQYQCAWVHDSLGREREAVPFYERAIAGGLSGNDLEGAFVGLGSTYRSLGEYGKAIETLRKGVARFPVNRAMEVFLAMALYNVGDHRQATELLLRTLAETSADRGSPPTKKPSCTTRGRWTRPGALRRPDRPVFRERSSGLSH